MAVKRDLERSLGLAILAALATTAGLISDPRAGFAHSGTAEEQAACTPDVLSLCFWDITSEERIVACLNKNIDRLSPACHKVMAGDDEPAKQKKTDKSKH